MEVCTGATLSIISYSTLVSTWPEEQIPEVKATKAKLCTYTEEDIAVKGAVNMKVKYGGQEANLTLTIVDGDGPTLLGRDWLQHLRLDWAALKHITQDNCTELITLLHVHSALFTKGLGKIKGSTACLYLKEGG